MARKATLKAPGEDKKIKQYKGLGLLSSQLKTQKIAFPGEHAVFRRISAGGNLAIFVHSSKGKILRIFNRVTITNFMNEFLKLKLWKMNLFH